MLHTGYVNQIHDRCLLNKKVTRYSIGWSWYANHLLFPVQAHLVKEAISRTLVLTLTLYNLWNKGIEYFR